MPGDNESAIASQEMPETRRFSPGFRLSILDGIVLVAGSIAAVMLMFIDHWVGLLAGLIVWNFFLFCNVLRASRISELLWCIAFVGIIASRIMFGRPDWLLGVTLSVSVTLVLTGFELRRRGYHGVGWNRINPKLQMWWQERHRH